MTTPIAATREPAAWKERIVELDALRGLAAINLMLFHYTLVYSNKYGYTEPLGFEFPWGKYGVQLFFMLSGVVNSLTLLKKRDPRGFLKSRALRILPCYYIVLALNLWLHGCPPLSGPTWGWSHLNWLQIAGNLSLLPNLFGQVCLEPVTWTLQVEVLFYGCLLVCFVSGWLDRPIRCVAGLSLFSLACSLSCDWLARNHANETLVIAATQFGRQLLLVDYLPLFGVGILLHSLHRKFQQSCDDQLKGLTAFLVKYSKAEIATIGLSLFCFHVTDQHAHHPVMSIGLVALLGLGVFSKLPLLRWRPLLWISSISFMLYLLHDNLGMVLIHSLNRGLYLSPTVSLITCIAAIVSLSAAAHYSLERPLAALLRRGLDRLSISSPTIGSAPVVSPLQQVSR